MPSIPSLDPRWDVVRNRAFQRDFRGFVPADPEGNAGVMALDAAYAMQSLLAVGICLFQKFGTTLFSVNTVIIGNFVKFVHWEWRFT